MMTCLRDMLYVASEDKNIVMQPYRIINSLMDRQDFGQLCPLCLLCMLCLMYHESVSSVLSDFSVSSGVVFYAALTIDQSWSGMFLAQ